MIPFQQSENMTSVGESVDVLPDLLSLWKYSGFPYVSFAFCGFSYL